MSWFRQQAITWINVDLDLSSHMASLGHSKLTHKQLEMHWCIISTVATDTLVLKHQAISIHNAEQVIIVLDQFHMKILHLQ